MKLIISYIIYISEQLNKIRLYYKNSNLVQYLFYVIFLFTNILLNLTSYITITINKLNAFYFNNKNNTKIKLINIIITTTHYEYFNNLFKIKECILNIQFILVNQQ